MMYLKSKELDTNPFLIYFGSINQNLIRDIVENLENKMTVHKVSIELLTKITTVLIELSQNILKYSKLKHGLIHVGVDDSTYFLHTRNVISESDKTNVETKLKHICTLDLEAIKKEYLALREDIKYAHSKDVDISFYEIAQRSSSIEFNFSKTKLNEYYFDFVVKIKA